MSPPPDLGKYIKSTTYCTVIPTPRLMHCTDASQALSPARWMHFSGSSCTCPKPLCRCSPWHTWRSPGGSKDSSLEGAGDGQISFESTLLSDHFPLHHLEGSRKTRACYTQVPIHMSKNPGTGSGGMLELEGTSGVTRVHQRPGRGRGWPTAVGQWQSQGLLTPGHSLHYRAGWNLPSALFLSKPLKH